MHAPSPTAGSRNERSSAPSSPPAVRGPRRTWRDPRLVLGVLIVAVSVLLGAGVLAAADDTTTVWAAGTDLRNGTPMASADLVPREVRFLSQEQADAYLPAGPRPPADAVVARDLAAGELLPRAALGTELSEDLVEVPLAVPAEAVVASLRVGETVDVWVTPVGAPTGSNRESTTAERVLAGVRVLAVPETATALGPAATRQVVVGVPVEDDALLGTALARLASGSPVLVRLS